MNTPPQTPFAGAAMDYPPASGSAGKAPKTKRVRDPKWDKKYEEKRKAKGLRGYGANLFSNQQPRCSKPYPQSFEALMNLLVDLQPADALVGSGSVCNNVFTDAAVEAARSRVVSYESKKKWRVWFPEAIWRRFNILKTQCAPAGTSVPEFAELLLDLGSRGYDGVDKGVAGANLSLLQPRAAGAEGSVRVLITLAAAADTVANISPIPDIKMSPMTPGMNSVAGTEPSAILSLDGGSPILTQDDILAFLTSVESARPSSRASASDSASIGSSNVSWLTPSDLSTFLTTVEREVFDGMADNSLDRMLDGLITPVSAPADSPDVVPSHAFPDLNVLLSVNLDAGQSPINNQILASVPYASPVTPLEQTQQFHLAGLTASGLLPTSPDLPFDLSVLNNVNMVSPPLPLLGTVPYVAPVITPFDPSTDPLVAGFQPLSWTPPQLAGQFTHQSSHHGHHPTIHRFHPYSHHHTFREVHGHTAHPHHPFFQKTMESHTIKVEVTNADVQSVHWASYYGPPDWNERVARPPPASTSPTPINIALAHRVIEHESEERHKNNKHHQHKARIFGVTNHDDTDPPRPETPTSEHKLSWVTLPRKGRTSRSPVPPDVASSSDSHLPTTESADSHKVQRSETAPDIYSQYEAKPEAKSSAVHGFGHRVAALFGRSGSSRTVQTGVPPVSVAQSDGAPSPTLSSAPQTPDVDTMSTAMERMHFGDRPATPPISGVSVRNITARQALTRLLAPFAPAAAPSIPRGKHHARAMVVAGLVRRLIDLKRVSRADVAVAVARLVSLYDKVGGDGKTRGAKGGIVELHPAAAALVGRLVALDVILDVTGNEDGDDGDDDDEDGWIEATEEEFLGIATADSS